MFPRWLSPEDRWPRVVVGTFLVLLGVLVTDAAWDAATGQPFTWGFFVGTLTTLPFIALIGYAGRWLTIGDVPAHRHRRLALWVLGGLVGFLCINLLVMTIFPPQAPSAYVGWARWAAALGGGTGALIGMFEARAIDRELTAERERLKREELASKNDRLDDFATILSHDLRNPLNVASGSVELANETCDSPHLENAETALSRMDEIIAETLVLARSGQVIGDTEPVSLEMLAWNCWQNVDTGDATLHADDAPTISADTDRVRHLLENLIRNSIEHAGDTATIRVGRCSGGFFVEDDGPGIPDADREAVFDPGFSTASDGNGFGLAIVRQIADGHGWTTTVLESESGGARFEFTNVETVD